MKQIFKNIGIVILGIIIGMIVNMGLIIGGGMIVPMSETIDPVNAVNWDFKYFIFPFFAHSIGTLSGAFIVSKISKNSHKQVVINIIDEGQGFKEKDTSKIFKRFYSNRPDKFGQHSGLGLNIVKNLVELHKGLINASNRYQKKGANIEIIFPKS